MTATSRVVHVVALSLALSLASAHHADAQAPGAIRGRVVDSATRQVLSSVSVSIEGTPYGSVTRSDGSFDIASVPAGARVLHARRIGFHANDVAVTVPAGGTANIEIGLVPQAAVLTEMVVTGYGSQRREAITGSVATVDAKDANVGVITNATQLIAGRTTGVEIIQSGGEPGSNVQVLIRGGTSIGASNDPLYVVDGVPLQNDATTPDGANIANISSSLPRNPLNSINPEDIETITILKDASATAIYGSRAANGVVLITTKHAGRDPQVEYGTYIGTAVPAKRLGLASGSQYRAFVTAFEDSLGTDAVTNLGAANTDWERAVVRTGESMDHSLAFTGGSPTTSYRASLNYFDSRGLVPNSRLTRYQARVNGTHDALNARLHLTLNVTTSHVENLYAPNENGGGFTGGLFTNMIIYDPTKPIRNADGTFYEVGTGAQDVRNPVAMFSQLQDRAPENRLLGNASATVSLREDLTAQSTVGVDNTEAIRRSYAPIASAVGAAFGGFARQVDRSLASTNFQQLVTYSPRVGADHEVQLVGGYEYIKNNDREFGSAAQGFVSDAFGVDNLAAGSSVPADYPYSTHKEDELSSFFARGSYGYANRYFLTGSLRRDGSSRLAPGHQWENFPGISGSWRISEERFMRGNPFGITSLALRAGWGRQGNQSVEPYQTQLLLKSDASALYPFGGVITTGLSAEQVGNPNLKWETAEQTNVGLDYGLHNDRITGSIEAYQKNTHDLLLTVNVPQPAVVPTQLENVGSIRNRGLEASADVKLYRDAHKSLNAGLTLTIERNQVTSLGDSSAACAADSTVVSFRAATNAKCTSFTTGDVYGQGQSNQWSQILMRGHAVGTFLAPRFVEVKNGQQMFACTAATPDCVNGEAPDAVDADRSFLGTANPSFTLGLNSAATWRAFDASWLWRGEFGGKVLNNTALVFQTKSGAAQGRNFLAAALDMPDNVHETAKLSSRWIEDRTFVRLQNVTIGYALPKTLVHGRSARVYVTADNLLLLTHYSGYDPEVYVGSTIATRGLDYLVYPPSRRFTVGGRTEF